MWHVARFLGVHVARTRRVLAAMLSGPVVTRPVVEDGQHGYCFKGRLRLGGILDAEALAGREFRASR